MTGGEHSSQGRVLRYSEDYIAHMGLDEARETIRLLQYRLETAIGPELEIVAANVRAFFAAYWKAGARWKTDSGRKGPMTAGDAKLAAALLLGKTRHRELFTSIYGDRIAEADIPETNTIHVFVCRVRRAFKAAGFPILTIYQVGYEVPDVGLLTRYVEQYTLTGEFDFNILLQRAQKTGPKAGTP